MLGNVGSRFLASIERLIKKPADIPKKTAKKYLQIIKKESDKLETLVNDFLEFSRLETGKLSKG